MTCYETISSKVNSRNEIAKNVRSVYTDVSR